MRKEEKNESDYAALHTVSTGDNSHHLRGGYQQERKQTHRAGNRIKRPYISQAYLFFISSNLTTQPGKISTGISDKPDISITVSS